MRWPRPWRGRKATRVPPSSPMSSSSEGVPNGDSIFSQRAPTRPSSEYTPLPPRTPSTASRRAGTVGYRSIPRSRGVPEMAEGRSFGAEGEARAARWLEASGYALLARNARAGGVEIDLVAARGDTIVFVEVKARRGRTHGAPEEAVDARKRRRLA